MRYLILLVFITNDWEGAYLHTKRRRVECDPEDLFKRLGRFKLTHETLNYVDNVCAEIFVFDENLDLVEKIPIDWVEIRDRKMKNVWFRNALEYIGKSSY